MSKFVFSIFMVTLLLGNAIQASPLDTQFNVVITQKTDSENIPKFFFQMCNLQEKGCSVLGSVNGYTEAQINEIMGIWVQRSPAAQYALIAIIVPATSVVGGFVTVYGGIALGGAYAFTSLLGHALQAVGCAGEYIAEHAFGAEVSERLPCDVHEAVQLHVRALKVMDTYYQKPITGMSQITVDLLESAHRAKVSTPILQEVLAKKENKLVIVVNGEALRSLEDVLN